MNPDMEHPRNPVKLFPGFTKWPDPVVFYRIRKGSKSTDPKIRERSKSFKKKSAFSRKFSDPIS